MNKFITILITALFPINPRKITILFQGYSGSNLTPIIRVLEKEQKYKVKIIQNYNDKSINELGRVDRLFFKINRRLSMFWNLSTSKLVITSHGHKRLNNRTKMLNVWHGIPIKSMGLMRNGRKDSVGFIKDDIFLSTSILFNTVMNSCMGLYADNYVITGYPRNDLLLESDGISNISKYFDIDRDKNIIIYMPTYSSSNNYDDDFPGFDSFNLYEFNKFLAENNLFFIMKLHPSEEKKVFEMTDELDLENIKVLKSEFLNGNKMDLYEVLNAASLLITDYSSVYFDYLLLDRPIIFNTNYLEFYREDRGLLLEPYDFWTPGIKVKTQAELHDSILKHLNNPSIFKNERKQIKRIFHDYEDSKATSRVIRLIDEAMKK